MSVQRAAAVLTNVTAHSSGLSTLVCWDNPGRVISGGSALQIWPGVPFPIKQQETFKSVIAGNNDFVADFKFQLNVNAKY